MYFFNEIKPLAKKNNNKDSQNIEESELYNPYGNFCLISKICRSDKRR